MRSGRGGTGTPGPHTPFTVRWASAQKVTLRKGISHQKVCATPRRQQPSKEASLFPLFTSCSLGWQLLYCKC